MLDSGAFSDLQRRFTPEQALIRQLTWEARASKKLGVSWRCQAIASYDFIVPKALQLKSWRLEPDAQTAIDLTVEAAQYITSQRQYLKPRHLILGCQGTDIEQYRQCVLRVLEYANADDWCGLGGWSKLGTYRSLLPIFYETLHECIRAIAASRIRHIHLYGVLLEQALAGLLFMADRYHLSVSCDSNRPLLDLTRPNRQRAGVRKAYWRDNVAWWLDYCAAMRSSKFYKEPPRLNKQLFLVF
ncbi:hypothetical protein IQ272_07005 [Chroococcidiopsidales cyanobacterium LEGE 13417]|nr:hypothetical protein [Chroococcidiopsidales cyanobacterium LEGE 13417]